MRLKNKEESSFPLCRYPTPLRYPGGKQRLAGYFQRLIRLNDLQGCHYVEPFAGGGGLGLSLLISGHVGSVHLNDLDRSIYAFWYSLKYRRDELCDLIRSTRISMREWDRQKAVQQRKHRAKLLDLGFSTLYLNRTNRSGIIRGGMIGGRNQDGRWSIKSRFDKKTIIDRIQALGRYSKEISVSNKSALDSRSLSFGSSDPCLIYVDPPYFDKSSRLYMNKLGLQDHSNLAQRVRRNKNDKVVVTYDTASEILNLYSGATRRYFHLAHTAGNYRMGREVMFFSDNLRIPKHIN